MTLVKNWRKAWRMYSAQALAAVAALPVIWMELPPDIKALIPPKLTAYIIPAVAIAGLVGRLIDQGTEE